MATTKRITTPYGRIKVNDYGTTVWISEDESRRWVEHTRWQCSGIRGKRLRVDFDGIGDLVGLTVNGRDADVSGIVVDSITSDVIIAAKPAIEKAAEGFCASKLTEIAMGAFRA